MVGNVLVVDVTLVVLHKVQLLRVLLVGLVPRQREVKDLKEALLQVDIQGQKSSENKGFQNVKCMELVTSKFLFVLKLYYTVPSVEGSR